MHLALDPHDLAPEAVTERFRCAVRQGRPSWLWPEVDPDAWRAALARIERAARLILACDDSVASLDGDPASLGLAGYTSGMGPLLGWWIERGRLRASTEISALLRLHLGHNRLRTARLEAHSSRLIDGLAARAVPVAVLKGAHTGCAHFPEPGTRPRTDLDLLVAPSRCAEAEAALAELGFLLDYRRADQACWRPSEGSPLPRSLSLVHADDPWSVDLHVSLDLSPGPGAARARLDAADPLGGSARWPQDRRALVLDQPLLLLHLAAHAGAGLHNLSLIRLVELVLVIRRDVAGGSLCWRHFLDLGASTGALGFCYPSLALAEKLSAGTVPRAIVESTAAAAPPAVRRIVSRLAPADAHRLERGSLAEHFMWASGWRGLARRIASDALPSFSLREAWSIYQRRAWQLVRRRVSR